MRLPSVKTIETRLGVDRAIARKIRACMENRNRKEYHILQEIDTLLGTHGVEGFRGLSYCNTGETYNNTVMFDFRECKWIIGSWGNEVERDEKRYL